LQITMDMRLYREKPQGKQSPKRTAEALWRFLAGGGQGA